MITYVSGDLFQSHAKVLVNPVNTAGVMGKGLALAFKKRYPAMYESHRERCKSGQLEIGQLWLFKAKNKWVLNFPTKKHWRNPSKAAYIEAGLQTFAQTYETLGIDSVAFPRLGCGAGELDWERQVKPLMAHYLATLPIEVLVYHFDSDDAGGGS